MRCPCRRRKQDFLCNEVQAGYAKVECDDTCQRQREKLKKVQLTADSRFIILIRCHCLLFYLLKQCRVTINVIVGTGRKVAKLGRSLC